MTLEPASFDHFHIRRDLINQRTATADPVKREQINLLLGQLNEYETAEPERKPEIAKAIARQMALMKGE